MSTLNPEFYAPYNYTPDVARARHNLSSKRSFTVQTGALVPVLFHRLYKGDDFKIRPMTLLQTILPLDRQLLDCFELRIETYLCPLTNYYGWMDNNSKENSEEIVRGSDKWYIDLFGEGYDYPHLFSSSNFLNDAQDQIRDPSDLIPYYQSSVNIIHKGSMFQHIGVPAGFAGSLVDGTLPNGSRTMFNSVNVERILCYLDIVRSYHVNTQYESIPFFTGKSLSGSASIDDVFGTFVTHQQFDQFFCDLRYFSSSVGNSLNIMDYFGDQSILKYFEWCARQGGGFFPVQHRPDLWRNLLSVTGGELQSKVVQNLDGTINIHEIQDKGHLQSFYDALFLSGGRYFNRLRTSFGMKPHQNLHIPLLLSVDRQLIDPSNITATAMGGDYDLGEMAAKVDKFNTGGYVRVKPDVDSYLVVLASITPLPSYSQGFDPDVTHLSFMDDFTPELQGMSFESVPMGFYGSLPVSTLISNESPYIEIPELSKEVGKNVKWMHYRTDVNRCYGEFTPLLGEFDSMVLSRKYQQFFSGVGVDNLTGISSGDISPYVNPLDYNNVFRINSLLDEPWSLHISFDIKAKRPILKRIKPSF